MSEPIEVAIIGGGLSGLVLAHRLKQYEIPFRLFEATDRLGGAIFTKQVSGFALECGPNSLFSSEDTSRLLEELGIDSDVIFANESAATRYLVNSYTGDVLTKAPRSLLSFLSSTLLPPAAKLRILLEPFAALFARHRQRESVRVFLSKHIGLCATKELFEVGLNGIWAGNSATLSATHCLPKLNALVANYRSLLVGAIAGKGLSRRKICSFNTGMSFLVETLISSVGRETIQLNSRLKGLARRDSGEFQLEIIEAGEHSYINCKHVVLCLPVEQTADILRSQLTTDEQAVLPPRWRMPLSASHTTPSRVRSFRRISMVSGFYREQRRNVLS